MPGKMARSDPRPSVRITRGAGSGQHLASVLQEGRENANIGASSGESRNKIMHFQFSDDVLCQNAHIEPRSLAGTRG
jgi:hypothetical protein